MADSAAAFGNRKGGNKMIGFVFLVVGLLIFVICEVISFWIGVAHPEIRKRNKRK